jgi:hypothetical protein
MVACARCVKEGLTCRLSSLSSVCGSCYRAGAAECLPAHIPLPDFSKINRELAKLESQEEAVEAQQDADEKIVAEAQERLRVSRNKMKRLRKQKNLLKRREAAVFEAGRADAEDLEQLEQREQLNQEIASTNPEAPAEAAVVDWSFLWDDASGLVLPERECVGV